MWSTLHKSSVTRLTHDISLDEFEDDDLSEITEITDERGMSLNCNGPDLKVSRCYAHLHRPQIQSITFSDAFYSLVNTL